MYVLLQRRLEDDAVAHESYLDTRRRGTRCLCVARDSRVINRRRAIELVVVVVCQTRVYGIYRRLCVCMCDRSIVHAM